MDKKEESKVKVFIKNYGVMVLLVINIVLFFRTCGMNNNTEKIEKKLKVIEQSIETKSTVTHEEIDALLERRLFDFLIYEDDIDKKKITLGQIKMKLDETGKK